VSDMCYLMGGESDDVPSKETKRRKPTKRIRIPVKEGRLRGRVIHSSQRYPSGKWGLLPRLTERSGDYMVARMQRSSGKGNYKGESIRSEGQV